MFLIHSVVDIINHLVKNFLVFGIALENGVQEVGVGEEHEDRV